MRVEPLTIIVIVDIDEKSLAEEGRWPWRRNRMAQLLDELFDYYHVSVVGFDVVFAEPDESSGLKILENLAKGEFAEIWREWRARAWRCPRASRRSDPCSIAFCYLIADCRASYDGSPDVTIFESPTSRVLPRLIARSNSTST